MRHHTAEVLYGLVVAPGDFKIYDDDDDYNELVEALTHESIVISCDDMLSVEFELIPNDKGYFNQSGIPVPYFYVVPLDKPCGYFTTPYRNIDEMLYELKEKIGEHLNEDFDYESRLARVVGVRY